MSVEQAKEFLVKIATDAEAADKARLAHEASLLEVAKELGFSMTGTDLEAAIEEIAGIDELSEEELDEVAGGVGRHSFRSVRPSFNLFGKLGPSFGAKGFTIRDSLLY